MEKKTTGGKRKRSVSVAPDPTPLVAHSLHIEKDESEDALSIQAADSDSSAEIVLGGLEFWDGESVYTQPESDSDDYCDESYPCFDQVGDVPEESTETNSADQIGLEQPSLQVQTECKKPMEPALKLGNVFCEGELQVDPDIESTHCEFNSPSAEGKSEIPCVGSLEPDFKIPNRPGKCFGGEETPVTVNAFSVELTNLDAKIFHYEFVIEPETMTSLSRYLFQQWKTKFINDPFRESLCFDGKRAMYSPTALEFDGTSPNAQSYKLSLPNSKRSKPKGVTSPTSKVSSTDCESERAFNIQVTYITTLAMRTLDDYSRNQLSAEHSIFSVTTAIDTIFRNAASGCLAVSGRMMFDPKFKEPSQKGIVKIPGYTQSVRTANESLLLILDATVALFFEEQPLVSLLKLALGREDLSTVAVEYVQNLQRCLKGIKFVPQYGDGITKKPVILNEISAKSCNNIFFNYNEVTVSVTHFFLQEHSITLKYPNLPCVVIGDASNQIYIPLELLVIAPNQKVNKSIGNIVIKSFKPTALRPLERAELVQRAIESIYQPAPKILSAFGLKLNNKMLQIPAHTLEAPVLCFGKESRLPTFQPKDGRWQMDNHKFVSGIVLENWIVLPFVVGSQEMISNFIGRWINVMLGLGINVLNRRPEILPPADPEKQVEIAIQHAYLKAGGGVKKPELLVFILPDKTFSLYSSIKRVCDTVLGVVSQCVTLKLIEKYRQNFLENLAMKINVKLPPGINVKLADKDLSFINECPTMLFGADVTHPPPNIDGPSIAAVVGSMDRYAFRYNSVARIQPIKAEIILDMGSMVLELLQRFYFNTGTKPLKIVFYRDGVSEGQFLDVIRLEITSIRKAFFSLDPEYMPKITFIIVQKRHHTRFYPTNESAVDVRSGNLMPGLTVDSIVTHPFEFDFFIQSHLGHQGLVKPTRYSVLLDENKFTAQDLMQFTYRLCYLYPRGAKSVSMVPPAFYAHVCAARAKSHVVSGEQEGQRYFALTMVKGELDKAMYFL